MKESEARQLLVKYGRRIYEKGFIAGTDGNLSVRLKSGAIVVTPAGRAKGFLAGQDMVVVDREGKITSSSGRPSSELLMHLAVYRNRPEITACCHAHPPFATAFSITGRKVPEGILPEVIVSVGKISLIAYAPPGTEMVPKALEKYIKTSQAFILRNHGVLTIGRNMEEAYDRMETVEHYIKIIYIAETKGKLNFLDKNEIRRLEKIRTAKLRETE
ncbi:Class II aldolase/adducin-like protein [Candidatus Zixiibacteriota bacterium]|nr:Class II aldolase/adducin-like protein [candidate division Zixibacteria bacterium]